MLNLISGQEIDGKEAINLWYSEGNKYSAYGAEPDYSTYYSWENFTQLIWKDNSKVGVGCAKSVDGNIFYVVAIFDGTGNIKGHFKNNVFPPIK